MVVTERKLPELSVKALAAGVVAAGWAPAVAPPVAKRFNEAFQGGVVRIDGSALAHGNVVGRVEAGGAQVSK